MIENNIRVLIACEESQTVCKAFRARGFEAYSCDIQDCSGGHPEWHIKGDALPVLKEKWDLIIAHPPCTYLSNAGAVRLYSCGKINQDRFLKGIDAKNFFMEFYNIKNIPVCIENPVSMRIFELPDYSQEIQPYMFGHPFTKKTRLWLNELPKLKPTNIVEPKTSFVHAVKGQKSINGSVSGAKNRSKTFQGIADAMAQQWGDYLLQKLSI